jgi:hypothetical protein
MEGLIPGNSMKHILIAAFLLWRQVVVFKGFVFILINIFKQSIKTKIEYVDGKLHFSDNLSHLMKAATCSLDKMDLVLEFCFSKVRCLRDWPIESLSQNPQACMFHYFK